MMTDHDQGYCLRAPVGLMRRLKIRCAELGVSMKAALIEAIEAWLVKKRS